MTRRAWAVLSPLGLSLGFALGYMAHRSSGEGLTKLAEVLEPLGTLWMNALRTIAIPLVVTLLVASIAEMPRGRTLGRWGAASIAAFVGLLFLATAFALAVVAPVVGRFPPSPVLLDPQRPATSIAGQAVSGADWLAELIPANAFQAALDGSLLPLAVLSALFAFALRTIEPERRQAVVAVVAGLRDACVAFVRGALWFLPLGAFVLAFSFTAKAGLSAAQSVAYFVLLLCGLLAAFTLLLYPITSLIARVSLWSFARAAGPSQVVAITTRSSLASLPALLDSARRLRLADEARSISLPLAVSVFKVNRPISATTKLLFVAAMFSVDLDAQRIAVFLATVFMLSFTTPGIPSAGTVTTLPAYLAAGLPLEGVMLFEAVDPLPDALKTVANVTADLSAAAVASRWCAPGGEDAGLEPIGTLSAG